MTRAPGTSTRRWRSARRALSGSAALAVVTAMTGYAVPLASAASPGEAVVSVAGSAGSAADLAVKVEDLMVPVGAEPDGTAVNLDVSITTSAGATGAKRPALILAHGFGGAKESVAEQAKTYAAHGYVVLSYTARGFGKSGGRIHLDDPAYEVADGSLLVDLLSLRDDVQLDGVGDPRVGVAGGSYGGALALMLGATDPRVDGVVASITWNDLAQSLFPQSAVEAVEASDPTGATLAGGTPIETPGVYKQLWGSRFFTAALGAGGGRGGGSAGAPSASAAAPSANAAAPSPSATGSTNGPARASSQLLCGRFDPAICQGLLEAAESGAPSPTIIETLRGHGPNAVLKDSMAPTLLVQGQTDSLFGLDQADANGRAITAIGAPLAIRWTDGGHDAPSTTQTQDEAAAQTWLDHYVRDIKDPIRSVAPASTSSASSAATPEAALPKGFDAFTYTLPLARRQVTATIARLPAYPGLNGGTTAEVTPVKVPLRLPAQDQLVLTPPGGQPASITTIPGLGLLNSAAGGSTGGSGTAGGGGSSSSSLSLGSLPTYPLAALPGASAVLDVRAISKRVTVAGAPKLTFSVTSSDAEVTLFVSLWQVQGTSVSQPRPLVAPLRLAVTPGQATQVTVALPAATWVMEAGSTWRVLITSTDSAFAGSRTVRADRIALDSATLTLPTVEGTPLATASERDTESLAVGAALIAVLLALVGFSLWRRWQRRQHPFREDLADTPLVVSNLVKTYADGHRAVNDVSWRAERGQVVGLLGPNGAGKTTTMRMMLGLISPDSGTVHVLGHEITPGAPILRSVGALVEGPGFLPHLTGRENLHAFWKATGRPPEEAGFEEAFDVAALGGALDRPARTYSHGMKQRLGIAQAMLGKPEVLFLDEPTNGLDPPQIAAMRPILQAYAATGRTVVVSSHLLAEVEMTCSHVVVMHAGRVITTGTVADLVASEDTTVIETSSAPTKAALAHLRGADGIRTLEVIDEDDRAKVTIIADRPRHEIVREAIDAGLDVVGVGSRRHLEEVFLGVIADASATPEGADGPETSMIERLRQVRAR